jgi:hypothetical protein
MGQKRPHQQQIRVLYAPVHYLHPTYAVFDLTVSFNALLPSNRTSQSAISKRPRPLTISQGRYEENMKEMTPSQECSTIYFCKYLWITVLNEKIQMVELVQLREASQFSGKINIVECSIYRIFSGMSTYKLIRKSVKLQLPFYLLILPLLILGASGP